MEMVRLCWITMERVINLGLVALMFRRSLVVSHGDRSERGSKESWSNLVDFVCVFFLVVGCGPIWPWFVGFFFLFFLLWLVVIWSDCC